MLKALVIADDLTGACDAAVTFRRRGMETMVAVNDGIIGRAGKVLGLSTDSRDLGAAEAEARIRSAAAQFTERPRVLFKKIDSLLRGNPGWEVRAALGAFGCEVALLTPAFPEMHRIVRNGLLYLEGAQDWQPIDVQARLKSQGLENLVHVQPEAVQEAIRLGSRSGGLVGSGGFWGSRTERAAFDLEAACFVLYRHESQPYSGSSSGAFAAAAV